MTAYAAPLTTSNGQIARELSISVHTVRNHIANMCQRLGVHSKLSLVAEGHRHGLLDPTE